VTSALIKIDLIDSNDRLRTADPAYVEGLAESIRIAGLDNPISVRPVGERFQLIAGLHRLEAHRLLERSEIMASVLDVSEDEARLIEIDENLFRKRLTALDRALFLATRKTLYLRLHPDAARGGARGNQHVGGRQSDTMSFSQATAEKLDLGARTIERAVQIAERIPMDLLRELAGTPMADNQKELLRLSGSSEDMQREIVSRMCREFQPARSLKAAIAEVAGHTEAKDDPADVAYRQLLDRWDRAPKKARDRFLAELRERGEL